MALETTYRNMVGEGRLRRSLDRLQKGDSWNGWDDDMGYAVLGYELDIMCAARDGIINVDGQFRDACSTCFRLLLARPPKPAGLERSLDDLKMIGHACLGHDADLDVVSEMVAGRDAAGGWDCILVDGVSRAMMSLARGDHAAASRTIDSLRNMQKDHEKAYLDGCGEYGRGGAYYLAGLYHLAAAIDAAAKNCRGGTRSSSDAPDDISFHFENAEKHLNSCREIILVTILDVLRTALNDLTKKYER